jgi:endonuclease/exonuclease/phosphatase family metal-dependent hydrolase
MKHWSKNSAFALLLIHLFYAVELPAQLLKVMTYNIRFDNPADGINQWPNRKQKVFDLIKKYNPDVIGVQEALRHQLTDIVSGLNDKYAFLGVGRDDGKLKGEFSAILYRKATFSVVSQNTFWLSETPEVPGSKSWDAAITRVATWVKLKDKSSKKEFLLVNTHFDHIGTEAREKSAALLKEKVSSMANKIPVIIIGDFNCTRDEAPYKTMMSPQKLKLTDAAPSDPPGTFCNFAVGSMPCRAIDYIFYTDHWASQNYVVINDNDGKNYPSDHLPVMVTLTLKN